MARRLNECGAWLGDCDWSRRASRAKSWQNRARVAVLRQTRKVSTRNGRVVSGIETRIEKGRCMRE